MSPLHRKMMTSLALPLVILTGGCDSFLDVNENPNVPEAARPDITLPAVLALFSNGVLGSWPATMSAEWMQQLSFNSDDRGFARYDRYEMRDVDAASLWDMAYATVLNEARLIMDYAEPREEWAYDAIAKIMYAWTLSVATDTWGPVPVTEALNPAIRKPRYDDQATAYAEIQRLLAEAAEELQRPNFPTRIPVSNDLLYSGDAHRWLRLVHTLQAQFHLRLSNAPGQNATDRAQQALNELALGFTSNLDDADFNYPGDDDDDAISRQPWYIARSITAYRLSQFYVELLGSRNDPRLPITAERAAADIPATVYRGHKNGDPAASNAQFSRVNNYFVRDTASFTWISYAQAKFIEAEARLIVSGAASADAAYRAGIRANMEKMRVSAAAITAYLDARPPLGTVANPLEEIITEKYIANFLKPEAWNDWRRTGYPVLQPVPGAMTSGIPHRFPTPASELIDNRENALATGIPQGLPGMSVKVWWASQGQ